MTTRIPLALVILGGAIVLGSLGPWAKVGPFSKDGIEGDGVFTLLLGIATIAIAAVRWHRWNLKSAAGVAIAAGLCAVIGILDWIDVVRAKVGPFGFEADPGWGLIMMTLAAVAAVAVALSSFAARAQR